MSNSKIFQQIRRFLSSPQGQATVFAVLVVFTAGCSGVLPGDSNVGGEPLDDVPQDVDVVMFFDSGIIQDQTTVDTMNGLIDLAQEQNPNYDGPESYEEVLTEAENESELDIEGFNSMFVFAKANPSGETEYAGAIMQTDWTVEELQEAGDSDMEDVQEDTYNGVDVYITEDEITGEVTWFADLGDGKFAIGTEQAVRDAIDTNQGDAEAFSGELRDAYNSVDDGYVKAAISVPQDQLGGAQTGQTQGPMQNADQVEIVTMVYHTDGNNMNLDARLTATNESAAATLQTDIDDSVGLLNLMAGDDEAITSMVDNIQVSQDGSNVVINFQTNPDQIVAAVEALQNQAGGEPPVQSTEDNTAEALG